MLSLMSEHNPSKEENDMPTISGNLYYTPNNSLSPVIPIPNVPIVLRNILTLLGTVALTNADGAFIFTDVPAGNYQVIKSWGTFGGRISPVNFLASAALMPTAPVEAEPPISALTVTLPSRTDMLTAISPSLLNISVLLVDVEFLAFYDAPLGSKDSTSNGLQMVGSKSTDTVNNGFLGNFPAKSATVATFNGCGDIQLLNTAEVKYTFTTDPIHSDGSSGFSQSNTVKTEVIGIMGATVKTVDNIYSESGNILIYTVIL